MHGMMFVGLCAQSCQRDSRLIACTTVFVCDDCYVTSICQSVLLSRKCITETQKSVTCDELLCTGKKHRKLFFFSVVYQIGVLHSV